MEKLTDTLINLNINDINDKVRKIQKWIRKKQQISHEKIEKVTNTYFQFYKQSLIDAEYEIKLEHKTGKALKDVIGKAYENHRKRVWEKLGFIVSKNKNFNITVDWLKKQLKKKNLKQSGNKDELIKRLGGNYEVELLYEKELNNEYNFPYNTDWIIIWGKKIVAIEEDKGHYLDSCFFDRTLCGFYKTINYCQKNSKDIPIFIVHSFTRYNKFYDKLKEDMDTRKKELGIKLIQNIRYTTLTNNDRLSKEKWFSKNNYNCFSNNANDDLIIKDILFMKSLIPP